MTIQTCLNSTTNNQYTLRMIAGSITWVSGTWLEVYGVNGTRALKVFMVGRSSESLFRSMHQSTKERNGNIMFLLTIPGRMWTIQTLHGLLLL